MYKISRGWKIIWVSFFFTLLIWITTVADYRFILSDPFLFFSKIVALVGTVGMCWTFILSTRLRCLETLFSGLDKVYHAHRTIGVLSFYLICFHPVFQFLRFLPDWRCSLNLFALRKLGPVELGLLGFVLFVTLISLTLWIKIPYHIWKKTHDFFICVLIFVLFHIIWIDKQVNASWLLSIWMYGFIALAIICYIYIRFLYWHFGSRYSYIIQNIEKIGKIWHIYLEPFEKIMRYKPAQFIYISFENRKLTKESHPFSISSSPEHRLLRVSIKSLGDYTSQLDSLRIGDMAMIWGPYGQFGEKFLCETEKEVVFIAGGIGITPFLSMLKFEADHLNDRKAHLIYSVKTVNSAYFHDEIVSLAERDPSIYYTLWDEEMNGFINIEKIKAIVGGALQDKLYFLCGPLPMMKILTRQLNQNGIKNTHIIYEDFNLLD